MNSSSRKGPNILVTGTPGTGKSTLCAELAEQTGLEWVEVGKVAKENNLYSGYDSQYQCHILDEDRLLDELEDRMEEGGNIVDYHGCDFFPKRWFDIVFVLTTDNTLLYDRLKSRGYSEAKLRENVECEIFHTILEEAAESYDAGTVNGLSSNTPEDLEENTDKISEWIHKWKAHHGCT